MWIQWPFFQKLEPKVIDPRWPLTPHLLKSNVCLYPRIIVSKSHGNTSMYADTVINFVKYHIHTDIHTHVHTTYRMSDQIVFFWTKFRQAFWTKFRRDKNTHSSIVFMIRNIIFFFSEQQLCKGQQPPTGKVCFQTSLVMMDQQVHPIREGLEVSLTT